MSYRYLFIMRNQLTQCRYNIDDDLDFGDAQARINALANADPAERARMSTTMSIKASKAGLGDKGEKARQANGDKDRRKHKKAKIRS